MSDLTGLDLFREARQMAHSDPGCDCERTCCVHEQVQLQRAQVLATLSLAAVTALASRPLGMPDADWAGWYRAVSEGPAAKARARNAEAAEIAELVQEAAR